MSLFEPHQIKINEPLKNHTTFKIGGPADIMLFPASIEELQKAVNICNANNLPYFIMGQGSNLLVRDGGYRGIVIKIGACLKKYLVQDTKIYAEAGVRLSELSRTAAAHGLTGLEFAEGIPGSLGGAVVMNAGAYGGEIKNVLESVQAISANQIQTYTVGDLEMAYRQSIFQTNHAIIVSAVLQLERGEKEVIQSSMRDYARRRREKQPLDFPSAGSVFRRPEGIYVGPIIEKMGLKGFCIGDAQVSSKHAGFIVNKGNATAHDVLQLIGFIQEKAYQTYGIKLKTEIEIIGEDHQDT
ncbi:MAG TPA: UDP-N-acetylmuramate dehydrogenase [Syntrophomonadaceae bacterium]|nr:UDP-N-acetylmuramate dehydrogenase [Syntrophomonadaceae bacterium]